MNGNLLFYECRLSGGNTMRCWGHSNFTLAHWQMHGHIHPMPSLAPEPPDGNSTTYFLLPQTADLGTYPLLYYWHLVVITGDLSKLLHLMTFPQQYWNLVVATETNGRYASYWNAFLFQDVFSERTSGHCPCTAGSSLSRLISANSLETKPFTLVRFSLQLWKYIDLHLQRNDWNWKFHEFWH